jgi:hypothetical protein
MLQAPAGSFMEASCVAAKHRNIGLIVEPSRSFNGLLWHVHRNSAIVIHQLNKTTSIGSLLLMRLYD